MDGEFKGLYGNDCSNVGIYNIKENSYEIIKDYYALLPMFSLHPLSIK